MDYKDLLNKFGNKLNDYAQELGAYGVDGNMLLDISKNCELNGSIWSYPARPVKFLLLHEDIPNHTVPNILKQCESSLEIDLVIKGDIKINLPQDNISDPFNKIDGFDIVVTSNSYITSWHLDRHVVEVNDGPCDYIHPIYHFTHGGHKMESHAIDADEYFGNAIIMRSPRLMHPPMDLILGIDFIFNQFIPSKKLSILKDRAYVDIINEVKGFLWMPFSLAIAKNYCKQISVDGTLKTFDPIFVASALSCKPLVKPELKN